MLRRYKYQTTGPYNKYELRDIYTVSQHLHTKTITGDNSLDDLEKDYMRYCKKVFWHYTFYPMLLSGVIFLTSDMFYPISALRFIPRMCIKFTLAFLTMKWGVDIAYVKMLEFPLMTEVIAGGLVKYTDWVDLDNSD